MGLFFLLPERGRDYYRGMKIIVIIVLLFATTLSQAKSEDCKVKIYQSEHIKNHFSRIVPRILKAKKLTRDALNAEFEISIKSDYVISPEKITLSIRRVSDKKILQYEESLRVGQSAGSSWYPNRIEMLKELLSCEELRAI
jgi:putative cell wall-binding protein